jgi:pimeloyl-ACP methyl ester carboxylesterase
MTDMLIDTVTSHDGTPVSYRRLGAGPGLVMVHGAMCSGRTHLELATALADEHTVYLPDRRQHGRDGASRYRPGRITEQEVEDLEALLVATGTRQAFGLSSGALAVMETALARPGLLDRVALYEPVLLSDVEATRRMREQLEQDVEAGDVTGALVTGWRGVQAGPAWIRNLPRPLLKSVVGLGLRAEARKGSGEYTPMSQLGMALRGDFGLVAEACEAGADRFAALTPEVLLLGGDRSPAFLTEVLDRLEPLLPRVRRVVLPGLGHDGSFDSEQRGKPADVARALRPFFGAPAN